MLVAAALLRRSDRLCGGQRAARFLLATGERDCVASFSDPETESGSERSVDRSVDAAVASGFGGGRRFSSSSPSSSRHAFAKPRLQPPSIVRLPEALKRAHDDASSSSSSPSSPSSSFGGARRLGPIAAALSGSLASRSRSLGRGGVAAAAWERRTEEEGDDDEGEGDLFDDGDDDAGGNEKGVVTLDLVTGKTARVRSRDGVPVGQADEEALGWRSGGGGKKRREKKEKTTSSSSKARIPRPLPPSYEGDATAAAYALARAPASYSAALHALLALRESPSWGRRSLERSRPPLRVLDFGAGTGSAFLAASAVFGGDRIAEVVAVERSSSMARAGRAVLDSLVAAEEEGGEEENDVEGSSGDDDDGDGEEEGEREEGELLPDFTAPRRVRWVRTLEEATTAPVPGGGEPLHYWRRRREAAEAAAKRDVDGGDGDETAPSREPFDLVLASFSLGESPDAASELETVDSLWERVAPGGALVVVEPGTPAGSLSVRAARDRVLSNPSPSHVAAPCLHDHACPLSSSPSLRTWCHFGQRLERSRSQRVAAASAAAATGRRGRRRRRGEGEKGGEDDDGDDDVSPRRNSSTSPSVSSHADVRFSYVALVAAPRPEKKRGLSLGEASPPSDDGFDGDGGESASVVLARVTRAPRPRSGHVLVGACFDPADASVAGPSSPSPPPPLPPSFGAEVVTVAASARPKGTYRAARVAPWGGVVALPASAVAKAAAAAARKAAK